MSISRREFVKLAGKVSAGALAAMALRNSLLAATTAPASGPAGGAATKPTRLNFLLITADDLNYDSIGFTGCKMPGLTPNLDKLASQGVYFERAHVTAAICQPSRQALMTGRYPHRNGAPGFDPIAPDVPTLQEQLRAAGYLNGILGKNEHLQPPKRFCWDYVKQQPKLGMGRDPKLYHEFTVEFIAKAKAEGKPFFLMANSHDPHRPFAGGEQEKKLIAKGEAYPPSKPFCKPSEVQVPGFLPDLPEVRQELSEYYTSVHRCDQTVGEILRALKESGLEDSTVVMFLSDNGMAFPFAKTNCYLASTRTPWLVRWGDKFKPHVEQKSMISGIDFMPTVLDAAGLAAPAGMDGQSFWPLLGGGKQEGRDSVYTVINTNSSHESYPMRCLQTGQYGYIFNAWSDGKTAFHNESQGGLTWTAMSRAGAGNAEIAARNKVFALRTVEELYDLQKDPNCLKNLMDNPESREQLVKMRKAMLEKMIQTKDPLLDDFKKKVPAEK